MSIPPLRAIGADETLPDPKGMVAAIARYGYSLSDALSDLVDNSLDAGAGNVVIRFLRDESAILRMIVADDGEGMDEGLLREAMRFGVRLNHDRTDLGKYGLGLKAASFSQCQEVAVVTRDVKGWVGGRRWTIDLIERGWICEKLDRSDCEALLDLDWSPIATGHAGTLIVWDQLDRLRLGRAGVDAALLTFMKRLPISLGIVFHRFLAHGRLRLLLDAENVVSRERSAPRDVLALDPFAHPKSGRVGYPLNFDVPFGDSTLRLQAHIWPPNSKDSAYRLGGGRIAERQGFYFYRNDRVIQAGGWNGWRQNNSEPHISLARAAIELPPELDNRFRLDVKKSRIDAPPEFIVALDAARAGSTQLSDWIQAAVDTYRASDAGAKRLEPLVPGEGMPRRVQRAAMRRAKLSDTSPRREVEFEWTDLDDDKVFELDREGTKILLNRAFRIDVLQGARASSADAPLVKVLLYLLLRADLIHQRSSATRRDVLAEANLLMYEAVKQQRW